MPRSPGSELAVPKPSPCVQRRAAHLGAAGGSALVLLSAAMLSVGLLGGQPDEAMHLPLAAVLAALLPLQLAALWLVFRRP